MSISGDSRGWAHEEIQRRGEGFLEDIKKNVKDLEDTVGRGVLVDHAFVQILLEDINALKGVFSKDAKLAHRIQELDRLSQRVLNTIGPILAYQQEVERAGVVARARLGEPAPTHEDLDLVGGLSSPSSLQTSDEYKEGLEKIGSEYNVRSIRPDGNCMFRSYATGLLGGLYDKEELAERLQGLRERGLISEALLQKPLESLRTIQQPEALEKVLTDKEISDAWVSLCRSVVGEMILDKLAKENGEGVQGLAKKMRSLIPELRLIPDDREVVERYADGISSMEKRWYGGQLELDLLDECLGSKSVELNVQAISLPDVEVPKSDNPRAVFLLQRTGDHIDVAFPKPTSFSK